MFATCLIVWQLVSLIYSIMAKIYHIESAQKSEILECSPFETVEKEEANESVSTYSEVLRILKEAFSLVDITKIIRNL